MNHRRIYLELIQRAQIRTEVVGYYEIHHVQPRSMGGGNESENLVVLTAREHFFAHWLLYRIYRNASMALAWQRMSTANLAKSSRVYAFAKEAASSKMSGAGNPNAKRVRNIDTGQIFESASLASKALNLQKTAVTCAILQRIRAAGYHWEYVDTPVTNLRGTRGFHNRKIVRNVTTGEIFHSVKAAGASVFKTGGAVRRAVRDGGTCGGSIWEYPN